MELVLRMLYRLHVVPNLILLVTSISILFVITYWIWRTPRWSTPVRRAVVVLVSLLLAGVFVMGYLLEFQRVQRRVARDPATWIEAVALILNVGFCGLFIGALMWRGASRVKPQRRAFLRATAGAVMAAPFVATGFGILGRNHFTINEVDVPIPNLPKDLQGLRITQVTDIHMSPFLSERDFARAVDMANETKPHLMLVTGDLVTQHGDPIDACLRQLARLRADAGILGCLGNHEDYCKNKDYVTEQGRRIGIDFLRSRSRVLRFGNASINFAGVDYQKFGEPYLVGAEEMVAPGMINVMLSHNPDVFDIAASQGYHLTIAGHTHGGQVNVEILDDNVNVARFFTHYVRGIYRRNNSTIYVSSGIGTIGVPVRIGAPAEVAVLKLCAS